MSKSKKNKPYRLGQRAAEVNRQNILQGCYPERIAGRSPTRSTIEARENHLSLRSKRNYI